METTINLNNDQYQLADLLLFAQRGIDVVLTDGSAPVARLIPIQQQPLSVSTNPLALGTFAETIEISDDFDDELPDVFWVGGKG